MANNRIGGRVGEPTRTEDEVVAELYWQPEVQRRKLAWSLPHLTEVWLEGYMTNGNSATAALVGHFRGDWQEACDRAAEWMRLTSVRHARQRGRESDTESFEFYSPARRSWWGCRMYPTEEEAREMFG